MAWPRRQSLRIRLLYLVLLALTPAIVLHVVSTLEKRHMARVAAEDNLRVLTDLAAGNARAVLDGAADVLRGIAALPQIVSPASEQAAEILRTAKRLYPQFSELARLDPDGRIVVSSRPNRQGDDFSGKKWFQRAMDVEMPEVNGMEATARLRAGEAGETNRHIPVVAMTAHALGDASARCLEAGMTGYLAKPLDFKALDRVLEQTEQRCGSIAAKTVHLTPAVSPPPSRTEKSDPDTTTALARLGGDSALLQELQADFLRLFPGKLRAIGLCRQTENWEEAVLAAHSLKNIVGAIGAETARVLAGRLEDSLRQADVVTSGKLLTELTNNLHTVSARLREAVVDKPHPAPV